jgi:hypothetical protein
LQSFPFIQSLTNIECAILITSVLFFMATFILNGYILLRRAYINHHETQVKGLVEKYQNLLIAYVFATEERKDTLFYYMKPHKKLDSSILLAQMILMKKNIKGQEAVALMDLYDTLGYDKVSFKKLHSRSWIKRHEGLEELMYMAASTDAPIFNSLINDRHAIVRIAALKALIRGDRHWQNALKSYKHPLSKWEQVQLCETINAHETIGLTDCMPLLRSKNQTVVALVGLCDQLFTPLNSQALLDIKQTQKITSFKEKELVTDF